MKRRTNRTNTPYENAFEEFLRKKEVLYIATDETRRPIFNGKKIKNFDFIISSFKEKYMVDVKGRRFRDHAWENWIHFQDIEGMKTWAMLLPGLKPLFAFTYLLDSKSYDKFEVKFSYKGKMFGFVGISLEDYLRNMKRRGKEKDSGIGGVGISGSKFKTLVKPITYFVPELQEIPSGTI